jgi:glycyl-tRNA synthetase
MHSNFTFRTREFEQMEIEYFVKPGTDMEWYERWIEERLNWYVSLGMRRDSLRLFVHPAEKLAFYSKGTTDIEFMFPWGWGELEGIADRTDYDLKQHVEFSGRDLQYFDDQTNESYIPYVIEPSAGADRGTLAFLIDAYREEQVKENDKRVVLKFSKDLAPIKAAVLPLARNKPEIVSTARALAADLKKSFTTQYDDTGSIGKLYRRQDEIGTLWCITVDHQSLEDNQVTIRDRDTMEQVRVPIEGVKRMLQEKLEIC